ncbi:MAG: carboxylesterase/lipase family protein [Ilumatobacter sp.]|uniref:carboxylesterase/lipase family protein n=1 Tax=Ilumatobacter sp. TaxID=1967498 RepID=UPI00391CE94A
MTGEHDHAQPATAKCAEGRHLGIDRGATREFRGIRFARAHRLEAPIDTVESDRVDARRFGAQAPQVPGALDQLLGGDALPIDEDCLHLNVVTPACDDGRRPVLFWVHGGAYVTGSGAMPWYDGNALAARGDVVVVTINYRLGALGFHGESSLGSLDMIAALRWVQRHVEAFGGDADNVTIFGESAGGSAVVSLLGAPDAEHLFQRVWSMSPSLLQLRTVAEAEQLLDDYLALLGASSPAAVRSADLDAILIAQSKMSATTAGLKNFAPTEGTPTFPAPILPTASRSPKPLVVGTNRDEMLLFTAFDTARRSWGERDVEREFEQRFDNHVDAIERYRSHRPGSTNSQLVSAMQTDEVFRWPVQRLAAKRSQAAAPTWAYEFHVASSAFGGILGACHGLDIPFAFHNLDRPGASTFIGAGDSGYLSRVADQFADALIAFARTGDPGWAPFDDGLRSTRIIGGAADLVDDPEPELRAIWERRTR